MKTFSSILLLGLSIGLTNVATAEPFNKRGEDWVKNVVPSQRPFTYQADYAAVDQRGFNNRGDDWVARLTPSASRQMPDQCPIDEIVVAHGSGFNNKYNAQC